VLFLSAARLRLLAGLPAALLSGCTQLFFYPSHALFDTPARHGLAYEEVRLQASDATALSAWWLPAAAVQAGSSRGKILFLHGNAENISAHFRAVAWLAEAGFDVLALDYRGYGGSDGTPSLAGMQLDIDAAMRYLAMRPGSDADRIFLLGQSLGGALALYYAAHGAYRDRLCAVIADSAFSDYRLLASEKLASTWLTWPLQWLARLSVEDSYAPAAAIGRISPIPVLLIHGDRDEVVPYHHSQDLFERAGQPKALWIVAGAGHTQALATRAQQDRLLDYLQDCKAH